MKLFLLPLFLLSLVAAPLSVSAQTTANLLVNPGFEKDAVIPFSDPWHNHSFETGVWAATTGVGMTQEDAFTGEQSMKISDRANSGFSQIVPVEYEQCNIAVFSFYLKQNEHINLNVIFLDQDRNTVSGGLRIGYAGTWTEWHRIERTMKFVSPNTSFIQVTVVTNSRQQGRGLFDDFSLKVYNPCSAG